MRSRLSLRVLSSILAIATAAGAGAFATRPHRRASIHSIQSRNSRARNLEAFAALPLSFEANVGQTDQRVRFLSRGPGYTIFLTGDETVLALHDRKPDGRSARPELASLARVIGAPGGDKSAVLRMRSWARPATRKARESIACARALTTSSATIPRAGAPAFPPMRA